MPDKKYKTPNGSIVSESDLRNKYGNKFNDLTNNGSFSLIDEPIYKTPNGKYETESVLKKKYGDKFQGLIDSNMFALDEPVKKKEESQSTSDDPKLDSGQEVEAGSLATPQDDSTQLEETTKLQDTDALSATPQDEAEQTKPLKRAPEGINRTTEVQLEGNDSPSTVLMSSHGDYSPPDANGKFVAFPTLFPKDPNKQTSNKKDWIVAENDDQAYELAKERGEVLEFDTPEEASAVAEGSWKTKKEVFAKGEFDTLIADVSQEQKDKNSQKEAKLQQDLQAYREFTDSEDIKKADQDIVESRVKDEKEFGFWDGVKQGTINSLNTVGNVLSFGLHPELSSQDGIAFKDEIKQVKAEAKTNKEDLTPEEINQRAEDLFRQKEEDYLYTDRANDYLEDLNPEIKGQLQNLDRKVIENLSEENQKINKVNSALNVVINDGVKKLESLKKGFANKPEFKTQEEVDAYNESINQYNALAEDLVKKAELINRNNEKFIANQGDLQTTQKEYDLFKRNYQNAFRENFANTTTDLVLGAGDFVNYLANLRGSPQIFDTSKARGEQQFEREHKMRKPVESVESLNGFLNYTSDLIANQLPILAITSTGHGGLVALGAITTGQKFAEMTDENNGLVPANYKPWQMIAVPLLHGTAEAVFELPTLQILKKGKRVISAGLKGSPDLFKRSSKEIWGGLAKDYTNENLSEQGTNFVQNGLNIFALGKEGSMWDNAEDVLKDSALLTLLMQGTPHLVGRALKPFQSKNNIETLEVNGAKMTALAKQLNDSKITDTEKAVITSEINKLNSESSKIMEGTIMDVSNMPEELHKEIIALNAEAGKIREQSQDVYDNGKSSKKEGLLKILKDKYDAVTEKRLAILKGQTTIIDVLPLKEQDRLKKQALAELTKELNPDGKKDITIDDAQITERAESIYLKDKDAKSQETTPEAKEPAMEEVTPEDKKSEKGVEDTPSPTVELSVENTAKKDDANWNYEGEGDALSGNTGKEAYVGRVLGMNNNSYARAKGEINPDSKVKVYKHPNGNIVAENAEGVTVGLLDFKKDGSGSINHLAVAPEVRRKGLASEMLAVMEKDVKLNVSKTKLRSKDFIEFAKSKSNETVPQANTTPNADVQSGTKPNIQQGKDSGVQPTPDSGTAEKEVEVKEDAKDLTIDELKDFLDEADKNLDKQSAPKQANKTPKTEVKVVTDRAERQKLKNAIAEGEMILKSGKKVSGKKYSENALKAIQKSVDNAKAKLGLPKSEVTPNGFKGYKSATAFKKGDKVIDFRGEIFEVLGIKDGEKHTKLKNLSDTAEAGRIESFGNIFEGFKLYNETTPQSKPKASDKKVEVKPYAYGAGGTLGIFQDANGKVYKSVESLKWEQDEKTNKFKKVKTGLLTKEHEFLTDNQDLKHLPRVGKMVETSEGKAFEIEKLEEVKNGKLTLKEIRTVEETLKKLNERGIWLNDQHSIMRRNNGEIVLIDLSAASERNFKREGYEGLTSNVADLLSKADKKIYSEENAKEHDRLIEEMFSDQAEKRKQKRADKVKPKKDTKQIKEAKAIVQQVARLDDFRGSKNAKARQKVIELVTGKKPTLAKSGINNLRTVLKEASNALNGSNAAIDEHIKNWANSKDQVKPQKVSLKGKTPLDKRKTKDPVMIKASEIEATDAHSIVKQFFINGGRLLTSAVDGVFASKNTLGERRARISYIRSKAKGGKTIVEIIDGLWQANQNLGITEDQFTVAVQEVVSEFNSIKAMAQSIVDTNEVNIDGDMVETPYGLMTKEQEQALIENLEEQERLKNNYYLTLTEDELISLEQDYKDYEQYEKRANQKNTGEVQKESRVRKDDSGKSQKSPELQEVDKQITEAQDKVKKAKTALQNKAKTLDESIKKDQRDLFGERESQNDNQLFDERVDLNKRDEATAKERQAVKDAEQNLKQLQAKKKELQESGEVTPEMDFEADAEQKPQVATDQDNQAKPSTKPKPIKKVTTASAEKIEDFGEKIGGAKKDLVKELDGISEDDIANLPLSKSFPEPNYNKLIEDGIISKESAVMLKFFYDSIPSKPRKKYRLNTWVTKVEQAIKTFSDVINDSEMAPKLIKKVEESYSLGDKWKIYSKTMEGLGFPATNPKTGKYEIKKFSNKNGSYYTIVKGSFIVGRDFKTIDEAVNNLKTILDSNTNKKAKVLLNVYEDTKTKDLFIGKKTATGVVRLMEGFKSIKEAHTYLKDNRTELENIWNNLKLNPEERRDSNRKRIGTDWRNGENVTPEIFTNAFGFRGTEFGNWVNNNQRQEALNETYDAFMDMANVLGISPRAISLNGTLAMAFGARGKGKAMAHYETDKVVINLTKKKGAGSLAHEWFHALDNYFARKYNKKGEFITDRPLPLINRADGKLDFRVREEVLKAFKDLVNSIKKSDLPKRSKGLDQSRSKLYWSTTIEMGARSFENFIIEKLGAQNEQNDFLANFKETSEWLGQVGLNLDNYPYPVKEESDAINGAFQNLFDTMEVVPEPGKTISKLDTLENLLNEWDKNLDKFGNENLSVGLPILVAKAAVKAMKLALKTAKTSAEVIAAGVKAIRNTTWYKSLTNAEQSEINETTVYTLIKNAQNETQKPEEQIKNEPTEVEEVVEPKAEPPIADFKRKSGKKSLLNRLIEGGNGKEITESLEQLGKEYDIRHQADIDEYANAFIDRVGIGEALHAAQNGLILNNDVKYLVYAEALERLKNEIDKETNANDKEALKNKFQELSNKFDNEVRNAGQGLAILNYIYEKNQNLKYSLAKQIADYKKNDPNGEIPKEIEDKFKELDDKLQALEKQTKDAEERAEKAEQELAIKNTQEDIARQKAKQNKNRSSKAKAAKILANKLRTAKIHKPNIFSSASPASLLWDGAIEIVAKTIEGGGKIADAVQKGLDHIKASDWYKSLAKNKQNEAEKAFKESVTKVAKPAPPKANENGELEVPKELFRYYVEQGYDDINEIAELIKEDIAEEFPDADVRDIRDLLTGYGKQINPNKDEITAKMNKLKEYGRLLSAYDDVMSGKMPFKSGLVRVKPEQRARELRRKVNRLAKELQLKSIDLDTQWANALDKIKSNLKNQIEDLDKQIAKGEKRKIERTIIKLDTEAEGLKKQRDEKRKILDALVGKPELTYEEKIAKAEALLERAIKKIKKEIDNNDIAIKGKSTPVESAKLTALKDQYKALRETKKEMRKQAGLIEKQRLETSKKRIRTQIEEYRRRLREKDFSKKKANIIKADSELDALRAEREIIFEAYETEKHRQELENRKEWQKWRDAIMEGFAVGRALKASLDLGLIGIQLRHFTYRDILNNPLGFVRNMVKMFSAIGSQSKADKTHKILLSHPLHSLANKLDIGLTNPDLRDEVREEASAGSLLSYAWNLPMKIIENLGGKKFSQIKRKAIGDSFIDGFKRKYNEVFNANLKIEDKESFSIKDQWKNLNLFRNVERGLSVYGNQIRFEEFLRGVQRLKNEGKDEINHKEDYEALASYIRTFSGRAKPFGLETNQKAANLVFFSFKNAASVFQQLNPLYYGYLQGKTTDNKDGSIRFKPTVANRMAMTSMLRTFSANIATIAFIMAGYAAIKGEDDDEMTLETDSRSSDFGKLRIGNFRYDPWGGYMPLIVFYARFFTEEVKKQDGTIYKMGESNYGIKNRADALSRLVYNKEAPITSMIHKYYTSTEAIDKETGETYRKTPYGGKLSEDEAYSAMPIFLGSIKEAVDNDYDDVKWFLTAYSVLGLGNTQDYGKTFEEQKADMQEKMDKRETRPERPSREDAKAKRDKKIENEKELKKEAEKLGVEYVRPRR